MYDILKARRIREELRSTRGSVTTRQQKNVSYKNIINTQSRYIFFFRGRKIRKIWNIVTNVTALLWKGKF